MTWEVFLVIVLAVARTHRLLAYDTITQDLRIRIFGYPAERHMMWSRWLGCPWCAGFWMTIAFFAAWRFWPTPTLYTSVVLAASEVVGLIASKVDT